MLQVIEVYGEKDGINRSCWVTTKDSLAWFIRKEDRSLQKVSICTAALLLSCSAVLSQHCPNRWNCRQMHVLFLHHIQIHKPTCSHEWLQCQTGNYHTGSSWSVQHLDPPVQVKNYYEASQGYFISMKFRIQFGICLNTRNKFKLLISEKE